MFIGYAMNIHESVQSIHIGHTIQTMEKSISSAYLSGEIFVITAAGLQ